MTVANLKEQLSRTDEVIKAKITTMNLWKVELKTYKVPIATTTGLKRPVSEPNFQDTRVRKLVKTEGPVDITKNFYVPLEVLESTLKLETAIDEKVCVLLVGHFQSGKSSTLHYLKNNRKNHFYIQSSRLSKGFLRGLCDLLSLDLCDDIIDFDKKIAEKYEEEKIVIMIDEFDRFLLHVHRQNDAFYQIDNSFGMITMLEDGDLKIKKVIEMSSQESTEESSQKLSEELSQHKKQPHSCLQKPVGILPSPLNSTRIIEASDFTKEQHIKFFHDIKVERNLSFSEKVVDDIYSRTDGYAGLEGLLASLCIEYAGNMVVLDFSTWNERFTEFIHVRRLLERFLQRGSLSASGFDDDDVAIVHLRAIGIIKSQDNDYVFTSNIIFDLLSIVIQGELYALLRAAVSYPLYKVFRETKTLRKSEKRCDIWVCNSSEYGIENIVNKVSDNEIKSANEQTIGYTEGRKKVCCMFVLNFVPQDSKPHGYQFTFPNVDKPKKDIYFETVHILYSQATRSAKILRNGMEDKVIPFANY
ncbi:hypothetical protein C1646_809964 [Rhizophagus diaphanus]|nr:hypothetical protein C1646_809964 [Rhizophagus diaphanus] [Rhizophagus sp. MUCL 43196]